MKCSIGWWTIEIDITPVFNHSPKWLYYWSFNFTIFDIWFSDLHGRITVLNVNIQWKKRFWNGI